MPKLIVGCSQKIATQNIGSRGAHVTLELDAPTAANPDQTRAQISGLFRLARQAVVEELARMGPGLHDPGPPASTNGHGAASATDHNPRLATANQIRAIRGLAARHRVDLPQMLRLRFRANAVEEMSIADASELIDELKTRQDVAAEI
jgi:hypothetical protein